MKQIPLSKLQKDVLKLLDEIREQRKRNTMHYKLLEAIKQLDYKDLAVRALWTFAQAFLAVFVLTGELIIDLLFKGDWTGLYALILTTSVAALAAGLSAVKTIVIGVLAELKKN